MTKWLRNYSHILVVCLIAICIVSTLAIAIASEFPLQVTQPTAVEGGLWATVFAAVGSLAVVAVTVISVKQSADLADAATRRANIDAIHSDQIRHDAVRPYFTAKIVWEDPRNPTSITLPRNSGLTRQESEQLEHKFPNPDGARFAIEVENVGVNTAVRVYVGMVQVSCPQFREQRPKVFLSLTDSMATANIQANKSNTFELLTTRPNLPDGTGYFQFNDEWYLVIYYKDVLSWQWRTGLHVAFREQYSSGELPPVIVWPSILPFELEEPAHIEQTPRFLTD